MEVDLLNLTFTTIFKNSTSTSISNASSTESPISIELTIGLAVYYCFVLIASLICNSTLIAVIAKLKKLHTINHLFFINLSVSNILTSLIFLPFDIEGVLHGGVFSHGKLLCGIYKLSFLLSLPLSTINLLLLTLDAFITIAYPYKRNRLVNKRNVSVCLTLTYTYAVIYTLFPVLFGQDNSVRINPICYVVMSLEYMFVYLSVNLFAPIVIIVVLNITMFTIANNQSKRILSKTPRSLLTNSSSSSSFSPSPSVKSSLQADLLLSSPNDWKSSPSVVSPLQADHLSSSPGATISCPFQATRGSKVSVVYHYKVIAPPFNNSSLTSMQENGPRKFVRSASVLDEENKRQRNCRKLKKQLSTSSCIAGGAHMFILNVKAAKRVAILVGECLFCWLFYIIVLFINITYHYDPVITKIGNVINYSSIFLNPLVYGLCNPKDSSSPS